MIALSDKPRARGSRSAPIPADHALPFEALNPFGHGGRREPDSTAELSERQTRVQLELDQQATVRRVEQARFGVLAAEPSLRSHRGEDTLLLAMYRHPRSPVPGRSAGCEHADMLIS